MAVARKPNADYQRQKERSRLRNKEEARSGREISPLRKVLNPRRRKSALRDLKRFCEVYLPNSFPLAWSPDHLKVIAKLQTAILDGGRFALAMPRGSGKTTLAEAATIWAVLYGHHAFVVLIGSTGPAANEMFESIRTDLETNELLQEDFPEVCEPIERLEGIAQRRLLYKDNLVRMSMKSGRIVLPDIPKSVAGGSIVTVASMTARIRGMKFKRHDGTSARPSLVIVDDPQSEDSAWSESQCQARLRTISSSILGLAGPRKKIAVVMPCTVIRPGDVADTLLDPKKHPEWNGERCRMLYSFPTNQGLWDQYATLRSDGMRAGDGGKGATEFYGNNREAMDAGAVVAWPERFRPDELSAIQYAMNLKLDDERAFFSEYQNDPLPLVMDLDSDVSADAIAAKINGRARLTIPAGCTELSMFIDVQKELLYYCVMAWEPDFTGYVLDYGSWPGQTKPYYRLTDANPTIAKMTGVPDTEGSIYAALERLTSERLARGWLRDDGTEMKIRKCLIDANWGLSTQVVYKFCRQSGLAGVLTPSHGHGITPDQKPYSQYDRNKAGETIGNNWLLRSSGRGLIHARYDTNYWKSFVFARLATPMGSKSSMSLWGEKTTDDRPQRPEQHRLFADHLKAEYRVPTEGRGRTVDVWKIRVEHTDNHWLDCVVGCCVGASILNVGLTSTGSSQGPRRKRVPLDEMKRRAQERQRVG